MRKVNYKFLLMLVLVLAVALRSVHLFDKENGIDEELSIRNAHTFMDFDNYGGVQKFYEVMPNDVNPPLFFIMLGMLLLFYNSVVALKVLVVLIGILSIVIFYLLCRRLFGEKFALFASFLYAVSPAHLVYSQHIRAYILLFLMFALVLYFAYDFLYNKNSKSLIYLTLVYLISFYSHYYAMLFIGGISFTVLLFYILDRKVKIVQYALSLIAFFILALPGIILLNLQRIKHGAYFANFPSLYEIPYPLYKMSLMADVSTTLANFPYLFAVFAVLLLLSAYGLYKIYKDNKKNAVFIGANLIMPYLVLTLVGFFWPVNSFRYLMFLLPLYVMTFSYGLFNIKDKLLRNVLLGVLLIGWAIIIWYYYGIATIYQWPEHIAI